MSDEEWAIFQPFVSPGRAMKGWPARDHRRVFDGIFWITRTGALAGPAGLFRRTAAQGASIVAAPLIPERGRRFMGTPRLDLSPAV
jgi:hypothetical protein